MHDQFMPHGYCYLWNTNLIRLTVITDSLVALAYYSIPVALFLLATKKKETIPVRPIFMLFGFFILFCGGGHALDILSIWRPCTGSRPVGTPALRQLRCGRQLC